MKNTQSFSDNEQFMDLKDSIIADILSLLWKEKQVNVFNYITNQVLRKKLLKKSSLNEKKFHQLFTTLFYFNQQLSKLKNYGDQKNSFLLVNEFLISMMPQVK